MMELHPGLMIWTVVVFLIFFFLMKKFAWGPILTALDQRESSIKNDLETAKRAREEAEIQIAEYKRLLAEAQAQAQSIVTTARQEAEKVRENLLAKSKEDAEVLFQNARKHIEAERKEAVNSIRAELASLVIASAEKVISKSLNSEDQKRLAVESLEGMKN